MDFAPDDGLGDIERGARAYTDCEEGDKAGRCPVDSLCGNKGRSQTDQDLHRRPENAIVHADRFIVAHEKAGKAADNFIQKGIGVFDLSDSLRRKKLHIITILLTGASNRG